MNLQNKTIFAFTLAGIIALGALPMGTMSAFAQFVQQDDVNFPIYQGDDDSLVAFFEDDGIIFDPDGCDGFGPSGMELVEFEDSFAVSGPVYQADPEHRIEDLGFDQNLLANIWEIHMPNIEDDFNTKLMRIQVTTCDFDGIPTSILEVTAEDQGSPAQVTFIEHVDDIAFTPGATYFYEDFIIHPNPDFETITIAVPDGILAQVVVDTISFDGCSVDPAELDLGTFGTDVILEIPKTIDCLEDVTDVSIDTDDCEANGILVSFDNTAIDTFGIWTADESIGTNAPDGTEVHCVVTFSVVHLPGETLLFQDIWLIPDEFVPDVVGGEIIPIDSTALVLAGLQTSAIWMLPILVGAAGAGFAAFKLRRK